MNPTIQDVKQAAAAHFGVPVREIDSSRRSRDIVRIRQIAMTAAKRLTLSSLPAIGRRFGGKDHTTVLHAVRKIEALAAEDAAIAADLAAIAELVTGAAGPGDDIADERLRTVARRLAGMVTAEINRELAELSRRQPGPKPAEIILRPVAAAPDRAAVRELVEAVRELERDRFSARERHAIERVLAAGRALRQAQGESNGDR